MTFNLIFTPPARDGFGAPGAGAVGAVGRPSLGDHPALDCLPDDLGSPVDDASDGDDPALEEVNQKLHTLQAAVSRVELRTNRAVEHQDQLIRGLAQKLDRVLDRLQPGAV